MKTLLGLMLLSVAQAVTYFVGTQPGDLPTIAACNAKLNNRDSCYIRAGTYTDTWTVTKQNVSFISTEQPTITGLDVIGTPWSFDDLTNTWSTTLPTSFVSLSSQKSVNTWIDDAFYLNGQLLSPARFPKLSTIDDVTRPDPTQFLIMDTVTIVNNTAFNLTSDQIPPYNMNGAKIVFGPGALWALYTCDVYDHPDPSTLAVTCLPGIGGQSNFYLDTNTRYRPSAGNSFYLYGKKVVGLNEWFLSDRVLTVGLPCTPGTPSCVIAARSMRLFAANISLVSGTVFDGLTFYGTTITTYNPTKIYTYPNNVVIRNCNFYHQWHYYEQVPTFNGTSPLIGMFYQRYYGTNVTIVDNNFLYSAGHHLSIGGKNNLIRNNVFYRSAYGGGTSYTLFISGAFSTAQWETRNTVSNNTFAQTSHDHVFMHKGIDFLYNDVYQSHLILTDTGSVFGYAFDGMGTVIAYNTFHDIYAPLNLSMQYFGAPPIYFDQGCGNVLIYRNLFWNTFQSGGIHLFNNSLKYQTPDTNITIFRNTMTSYIHIRPGTVFSPDNYIVGNLYQYRKTLGSVTIGNDSIVDDTCAMTQNNNLYHTDYVSPPNYQLRGTSQAIGLLSPSISPGIAFNYLQYTANNPYATVMTEKWSDAGALDAGQSMWVTGATIRTIDTLTVSCSLAGDVICYVTNLPIGRKLASTFQLLLMPQNVKTSCVQYDTDRLEDVQYICRFAVTPEYGIDPTGTITAMSVYYFNGNWVYGADVMVAPFSITNATLSNNKLRINGYQFTSGDWDLSGTKTTLTVSTTNTLYSHPISWLVNTADLIANQLIDSNCRCFQFLDTAPISFWFDSRTCNTATTEIWLLPVDLFDGKRITAYLQPSCESSLYDSSIFLYSNNFSSANSVQISNAQGSAATYTFNENTLKIVATTSSLNKVAGFLIKNNNQLYLPDSFAVEVDIELTSTVPTILYMHAPRDYASVNSYFAYFNGSYGYGTNLTSTPTIKNGTASWTSVFRSTIGLVQSGSKYIGYVIENRIAQGTLDLVGVCKNCLINEMFGVAVTKRGSYQVSFRNLRIRPFYYPEPTVTADAYQPTGVDVMFGDTVLSPCLNVEISPTLVSCQPQTSGNNIVVINRVTGVKAYWTI